MRILLDECVDWRLLRDLAVYAIPYPAHSAGPSL
jgi:hypothetical protein